MQQCCHNFDITENESIYVYIYNCIMQIMQLAINNNHWLILMLSSNWNTTE